jgi:hypothetical protein
LQYATAVSAQGNPTFFVRQPWSRWRDRDLLNRPIGEAEDPVLQHRQSDRDGARQTGVETAQHAGDDAVADDDQPLSLGLGKPGGDAAAEPVIALAIGGSEIPFVIAIAVEDPGDERGDLVAAQSVPRAERDFAQPLVKAQRPGAAEIFVASAASGWVHR